MTVAWKNWYECMPYCSTANRQLWFWTPQTTWAAFTRRVLTVTVLHIKLIHNINHYHMCS